MRKIKKKEKSDEDNYNDSDEIIITLRQQGNKANQIMWEPESWKVWASLKQEHFSTVTSEPSSKLPVNIWKRGNKSLAKANKKRGRSSKAGRIRRKRRRRQQQQQQQQQQKKKKKKRRRKLQSPQTQKHTWIHAQLSGVQLQLAARRGLPHVLGLLTKRAGVHLDAASCGLM